MFLKPFPSAILISNRLNSFSSLSGVASKKNCISFEGKVSSAVLNASQSRRFFSMHHALQPPSISSTVTSPFISSSGVVNNVAADVHSPSVYAQLVESLKDSFVVPPELSMWHISCLQEALSWIHTNVGLPWWASIVTLTCAFRTLVLPINISLVRNTARLAKIRPSIESLEAQHSAAKSDAEKVEISQKIVKEFEVARCNPFKNIISPLIMTPMFLSVFMSVERTIMFTPSCENGGTLWFENLAIPDSTYFLPILSAITWAGTVKAAADRIRTPRAKAFENFITYLSLVMIPITFTVPQGIFIYWITSNVFSLLQFFCLRFPAVRRLFGIPVAATPPIPSN